ncbi:carboxymuconolactone decarboxylase family protein [Achromobacter sp. GG226]|uniref:carboxymuconolactone decarboxylase family protein n=1 Tax=Verticiella alkaliphila TaxID=2779529 RepID=UPI001C0E65E0|nr:carboxymuconolactone decarboxylase family protein [Verticiella sp. GG226]MBU4609345.1 carboxymuconolactone decarboxylase family protein [Verticiella sp. GG226]
MPDPDAGRDRYVPVAPDALDTASRALYERLLAERGRVPAPFVPLLATPPVGEAIAQWSAALQAGALPDAVREAVFLRVARRQRCRYLWANHVGRARAAGLPDTVIAALASGAPVAPAHAVAATVADDQTRQALAAVAPALALTTALLETAVVTDAQVDAVQAVLGTRGVVELTSFCGFAVSVALLLTLRQPSLPAGVPVPF